MATASSSAPTSFLVTGASGQLGRRVLELLLEVPGTKVIATTRNPDTLKEFAARGVDVRRADFDDEASLVEAFRGAKRALLISTDAVAVPGQRERQQLAAVRAFKAAGVEHVVYTSLPNPGPDSPVTIAPSHEATEKALEASGLGYTALRNNLYAELQLQALTGAVKSGKLIDARGKGAAGFISREDCARAAAAALRAGDGHRTIDIGGALVTSEELAAIATELTGTPVAHVTVPAGDLRTALLGHGLPDFVADMLASFDTAIAQGKLATQPSGFEQLTGRKPETMRTFLTRHRADLKA